MGVDHLILDFYLKAKVNLPHAIHFRSCHIDLSIDFRSRHTGLSPESLGRKVAVTVLYVPYSLDSGPLDASMGDRLVQMP